MKDFLKIIIINETEAPSPTCIVQGRPKNTTTLLRGMTHYLRRDDSQASEGDQLGRWWKDNPQYDRT